MSSHGVTFSFHCLPPVKPLSPKGKLLCVRESFSVAAILLL